MNAMSPITFAIHDLQTGCDIISRIPLANPQPVSYTHLDVYKRQRYAYARLRSELRDLR